MESMDLYISSLNVNASHKDGRYESSSKYLKSSSGIATPSEHLDVKEQPKTKPIHFNAAASTYLLFGQNDSQLFW